MGLGAADSVGREIVAEYRAFQAGKKLDVYERFSHGPGDVVGHGPAPITPGGTYAATFVVGPVVTLIAVGSFEAVGKATARALPALKEGGGSQTVVTPLVRHHGYLRAFSAASGQHLLGVLELGEGRTLVLGVADSTPGQSPSDPRATCSAVVSARSASPPSPTLRPELTAG